MQRALVLMKTKAARRAGLVLFFFLSFVFFLFLGFPTDALVNRISSELTRQSKGAVSLKVGRSHLWRVTGVALEDVHVLRPNAQPIALEALRVRARLLPLLLLRPSATVQIPLGRGEFTSTLTRHGDGVDVHLTATQLDFAKMPTIARTLGVPMAGVLDMEGDLSAVQDLQHAQGHLTITLDHLAVGPGALYGLSMPRLDLAKIEVGLSVQDGHARLQRFAQTGGTLNLAAQGTIELGQTLARSTLNGCAKVRLDPVFLDKNPQLRSVMQLAEVQLKRDGDGFLNAPLVGPLLSPQLRPGICPKR